MKTAAAALFLFLISACTYEGTVPTVSGASLADVGQKQPGRYAAVVQSGGWNMTTELKSWTCSAHDYKADLNPAWEAELKEALMSALEIVDFVAAVLTPPEIAQNGYDGVLVFTQSNAAAVATVNSGFFTGETNAETKLDMILVIQYPNGQKDQQLLSASGSATQSIFTCDGVADTVAASGGVAVQNLVRSAVVTAKLLLAQSTQRVASEPALQ